MKKITKEDLAELFLDVSPSFKITFLRFINEWKDDDEYPCYLIVADYAKYVGKLYLGKAEEFNKILTEVENILNNCNEEVKRLIVVGLLEDLQFYLLENKVELNAMKNDLGRMTLIWWDKLIAFWNNGIPLEN